MRMPYPRFSGTLVASWKYSIIQNPSFYSWVSLAYSIKSFVSSLFKITKQYNYFGYESLTRNASLLFHCSRPNSAGDRVVQCRWPRRYSDAANQTRWRCTHNAAGSSCKQNIDDCLKRYRFLHIDRYLDFGALYLCLLICIVVCTPS